MKNIKYFVSYLITVVEYYVIRMHRKPIPPLAKQALTERLENLKKANTRKYEQKFLVKYLNEIKVQTIS